MSVSGLSACGTFQTLHISIFKSPLQSGGSVTNRGVSCKLDSNAPDLLPQQTVDKIRDERSGFLSLGFKCPRS